LQGDRTGRIWNYDLTLDRLEHGERWYAKATDDGSPALLHHLEKGTLWDDEVERVRTAIARRSTRGAGGGVDHSPTHRVEQNGSACLTALSGRLLRQFTQRPSWR
jgi:hypothetical protein